MSLTIHVNTGTADLAYGAFGVEFTEIDTTNDEIIFSDGSDTVKDGEAIPSDTQLNSASPILTGVEQTFDTYLLADSSAGILKEIHNMGAGNYRYVMAFVFDALTVSEPVLEIWDDTDLDSIDSVVLGSGVASSSWFRGVVTTDALPGVGWTGSRLAGSSDGYFLWLNNENGALSGASNLYCQLKLVIPATQTDAGSSNPVIAVKYATL
jgi:hypothetical protein